MNIINLGEIDKEYINSVGGKARGLDKLVKEGYNVPRGFVIIGASSGEDVGRAEEFYKQSGLDKVAVRSSASMEDGVELSYAGQFVTLLNVEKGGFKKAVYDCLNSLEGVTGKAYQGGFSNSGKACMNVVVQEMVDSAAAGVCFTSDPAAPENILVEAVEGLGEALVSGAKTAERYSVQYDKNTGELFNTGLKEGVITAKTLDEICRTALKIQASFNMPVDIEWAAGKNGALYLLQARPITTLNAAGEDEFDPKVDLTGHVITRCNIGEMLPGAVTPLTMSVSVYAIDWGMRKMLQISGGNKKMKELPDYSCALSVSGHLFLNLTPIYRLERTLIFTGKQNIDVSLCGQVLEQGSAYGKKVFILKRFFNLSRYMIFLFSRKKALKKLENLTEKFSINKSLTGALELYNEICKSKHIADNATLYHYVTSAHSGAMSSAIYSIADEKFKNKEKSKAFLAELLEGIEDIESVDILSSLRVIARAAIQENPAVKSLDAISLGEYLKNAGKEVQSAKQSFLERHGHRTIREAELRSKGWADDAEAFTEYLRAVILGGAEETPRLPASDINAIVKKHGFKGVNASALRFLARQSREGVKNREHSKSKMIKVLDEFKKAYLCLARLLVAAGRLPDEDLIFFVTHEEIGLLIREDGNPALVKRAVQRRRLLKSQSELRFNEVSVGKPAPLAAVASVDYGKVLKGTPISRGLVQGTVRVVKCIEDASMLQKGEIMVAVYTDIGWSPYYCLIEGLITEVGSALSHGAVVAREYALPFVSNIVGATSLIRTGDTVTLDGFNGHVTMHEENCQSA